MTNWVQTQVKINNTDVTTTVNNYKYQKKFGESVSSITIEFTKTLKDTITPEIGQTVEVWRGWTTAADEKIFKGTLTRKKLEGGKIIIISEDMLGTAKDKEVTYSYDEDIDASAGKISDIFKDLISTYTDLTADAVSVQDSGDTDTLNKFICDHADVFERCKTLADILDWQFYYRADTDKVYFEPKGYTNNSTVLTTGTQITNLPKWTYDRTLLCNDVTFIGAEQLVETTETFNGDGNTKNFTLTYKPHSVKVYISSTLKSGTVEGSGLTKDYYIDYEKKRIRFASAPGSGSDNIEVRYSHAVPTPVNVFDETSKTNYGEVKKTFIKTDIRHIDDAERRATKYLEQHKNPFVFTKLQLRNISLASISVGNNIRIDDNINNEDRFVVIKTHTMRYPSKFDEVDVGDKEFKLADWGSNVAENLHRLEEEQAKNQEFLLHVVSAAEPIKIQRDTIQILARPIGSTFILGHDISATDPGLSRGMLGSFAGSLLPLLGDHRGFNYTENLSSTTYYDSGNSSFVDWNTASGAIYASGVASWYSE